MFATMPTTNSKLPFGKHRGMPLEQCPVDYLQWMASKLRDSDFHEWAVLAKEVLKTKSPRERKLENLDQAADDFLKEHGVDPKKPSP
jgi:hypothetical protein